jgi:hypothetical protein
MSNITVGRYTTLPDYSGWIEGEDASGNRWITYLDGTGRPVLHWAHREESGAVIGEPVVLA